MITLYRRRRGPYVVRWQLFLRDRGAEIEPDGIFGPRTETATRSYQREHGLAADGIVGPRTLERANRDGAGIVPRRRAPATTTLGPLRPGFRWLGVERRRELFGAFRYQLNGRANGLGFDIVDGWDRTNIGMIYVPQIAHLPTHDWTGRGRILYGFSNNGRIRFNRRAAHQLRALWAAWEAAGLLDRVLTWDGSYVTRMMVGARNTPSNHAYGLAFDINVATNPWGRRPPAVGARGSVRELVAIANEHGFYWGGHWDRQYWDGMHFEIARLIEPGALPTLASMQEGAQVAPAADPAA